MGDEYIKRSDVLIKLEIAYDMARLDQKLPISDLQHEVNLIKAAEVQRIKHGYWEEVTDYGGWGDTHYRCSVCGEEWYLEDGKPKDNNMNFCPRCGAKMDAEPDEPWQSE